MNEKNIRLVTAESVRAGHPDKFCDQVADAILDAHFRQDPNARVAVEVFATAGKMIIGGEVTSKAEVDCGRIVADAIDRIGYTMCDLCEDSHDPLELEIRIHDQSPDISAAVGAANLGAGDQGIVVGYATNETEECLPLPVVLAHCICKRLDELKPENPWLGADGKVQVTVAYEDDVPVAVTAVVVSLQHDAEIDHKSIRRFIGKEVLGKVLPRELLKEDTSILINPSGKFALGGPAADAGLTGRKLAVDQYGPVAHIGGGALSGKDPTKVDRSGAYAARWVAKNIVAAGMAKRCEVQIAYVIGKSEPVSVTVDTFGTGVIPDSRIEAAVKVVFDLTPAGIIRDLKLNRPIYSKGEFCAGEWCRFCKARYTCRKRSEYHMRLAERDFKQPDLLSDEEIADILPVAESLNSWVQDLMAYATQEAVDGKHWPGYKLVAGRTVRKYTSEAEVIKAATDAGYSDIYKTTLLGVGDLEKRLGRKKFSEVLGKYVVKPQGAPTLVPETDPRKPYSDAAGDFKA